MIYTGISCKDFCDELSSRTPVPGGGGASAYTGALGIALGNMVGYLTLGKKKYADVEDDVKTLIAEGENIKEALLELVQEDAEVFAPLSKAYSMPSDTPQEAEEKEKVMEECLKRACSVPLEIMRLSARAIELQAEFAEKGSKLAISDAGTGAVMCRGALEGGALNVFINTKLMKDRSYAEQINDEANKLLDKYSELADKVYRRVLEELR